MCHTLIFVLNKNKKISTLPSTQTIKVIDLIFFEWAGLEKLGYKHAFQPYSLRPFSKGGRGTPTPQAIHRFRPPSLYRVKLNRINNVLVLFLIEHLVMNSEHSLTIKVENVKPVSIVDLRTIWWNIIQIIQKWVCTFFSLKDTWWFKV